MLAFVAIPIICLMTDRCLLVQTTFGDRSYVVVGVPEDSFNEENTTSVALITMAVGLVSFIFVHTPVFSNMCVICLHFLSVCSVRTGNCDSGRGVDHVRFSEELLAGADPVP